MNTLNTYILTQCLLIVKRVFIFNRVIQLIFFGSIRYNSDIEMLGLSFLRLYYTRKWEI